MSSNVAEKEAGPISEKEMAATSPSPAPEEKKKREYKEFGEEEEEHVREYPSPPPARCNQLTVNFPLRAKYRR